MQEFTLRNTGKGNVRKQKEMQEFTSALKEHRSRRYLFRRTVRNMLQELTSRNTG